MGVFLFFERPDEADLASGVLGLCKFNGFLWSLTAFTTPTLLCIASAFRFMAIYMPYSYKDKVTLRNASVGECAFKLKLGILLCDLAERRQVNIKCRCVIISILF